MGSLLNYSSLRLPQIYDSNIETALTKLTSISIHDGIPPATNIRPPTVVEAPQLLGLSKTMPASQPVDFAAAFGYHSEGAAILFAVLYFPLFCYFCLQSFARPTYVHIVMAVFCASTF